MEQKRDLAIVLRSVPYEERHRVVTALTERHGRITALARNSIQSRRFGGTLEPFSASLWRFTERPGSELVRLEEAEIRRSFDRLRKDFRRLAAGSLFNELMLRMAPERDPCPDLFRLHSNALAALDEMPEQGAELPLLNAYVAKLLQWSGSQPRLEKCLSCHLSLEFLSIEDEVSCLISEAGWICANCRSTRTHHIRQQEGQSLQRSLLRMKSIALKDFYLSLTLPIRKFSAASQGSLQDQRDLFRFLEALMIYHLPGLSGDSLKSLRFLGLESIERPAAMSPQ